MPKHAGGAPKKAEDQKRMKMHFPVAPGTKELFVEAAERLGKKNPGHLLDDLAQALRKSQI
jgi:hypothetical protein